MGFFGEKDTQDHVIEAGHGLSCISFGHASVVFSESNFAAIVRKLLVTMWYLLTGQEAYNRSSDEDLAYKMLTWAWHIDQTARSGMTNQQFAKYGLLRLATGEDVTRIVRGGLPRRIAQKEEVVALKPELRRTQ